MKLKMYSVYDSKVEAYLQPFFMRTRGEALRAFQTTVSDPGTHFYLSPGDFTLFEIGEYDDSNGMVEQPLAIENLGNGMQFKKQEITEKLQRIEQEA